MEAGLGETALFQGNQLWLHLLNSPGVHSEDEDGHDISLGSVVVKSMCIFIKAVMGESPVL